MPERVRSRVKGHPTALAILRETIVAAWARSIPTLVMMLVTAVACVTVLLTMGRAMRAEQDVIDRLDQLGTLLIAVSDNQGASGLSSASVTTLESMTGVDWVFALGSATDGHNANLPVDGTGVAVRMFYGDLPSVVSLEEGRWPRPGEAIASVEAAIHLGFSNGSGGVNFGAASPVSYPVVGTYTCDSSLKSLHSSVLVSPTLDNGLHNRVLYIYVKATEAGVVDSTVKAIPHVITAEHAGMVTVESPTALREVRATIASDMTSSSRYLMLATVATGMMLISVTMFASAAERKTDFGRRRALGASRSVIAVMVLIHAAIASTLGAFLGIASGMVVNMITHSPQTTGSFAVGLALMMMVGAMVASLLPALFAATRDPVRVLRVP